MAHLWLGCYLTVPLAMIVVAWVLQNRASLIGSVHDGRWKWTLFSLPTLAAVVICAALGFDFPYYPVFTAFLLLIVGPYAALQTKSWTPVIRSGFLIAAIVFFFAANVSPNLVYRIQYGKNPSPAMVSTRSWTDSERYALKIASLVLPAEEHPIRVLKKLRNKYNAGTITASEDGSPALGMIASGGFLFLIGWLLWRQNHGKTESTRTIDWMSLLTIATLLLATVGGFSALSSILATGVLRGYNRISIFIMFFSLVPVGLWLSYLQARCWDHLHWRTGFVIGLLLLTLLGSFEQSRYFRKAGVNEIAEFDSDRSFVRQIEQDAGPTGKVFQYPLQNFLSYAGPAIAIDPYTHFRGYLHSDTLTWSFGAVVGRQGADLQDWIASLEPEEALPVLTLFEFNGIYIDRKLYADHGAEIESDFARLLKAEPVVSEDQRLTYFSLKEYAYQFHSTHTPEQVAALKRDIYPTVVGWNGFDAEEQNENETWRWCRKNHAILKLNNMGSVDRLVKLQFALATGLPQSAECRIKSDDWEVTSPIGAVATHFSKTIPVPPGVTSIQFNSTAKPMQTPARDVNFRIINFSYEVVDDLDLAESDKTNAR
ncbi:putative carbohydrate translocase [Blastopirellula marina DSM 3645]|uniref:Putative carbohydrate translocase n=2 Tax=Blastopirellula marina TaxID=124 RepID=A3ZPP1_9BACT|nr:putative carbohydrate translocase [Blastopirellula marina DSM 3645]